MSHLTEQDSDAIIKFKTNMENGVKGVPLQLVTVTPKAAEKIMQFMKEEKDNPNYLRIYVQGGGCSGLSYGMGFESKADEDDAIVEDQGVKLLIDSYSQEHLKGANIDYIETVMGSGFKIDNPNVKKSCSCGSSFNTE